MKGRSVFLLTRPSRGATRSSPHVLMGHTISTHTPLAGRDPSPVNAHVNIVDFYSHAPRGARLADAVGKTAEKISTHTPLAGRDASGKALHLTNTISTHTPLAGRDRRVEGLEHRVLHFYSHAPRGARPVLMKTEYDFTDFYSHAPRGARRTFTPLFLR